MAADRFPRIPGLQIVDELGRGAHSVVYRAVQAGSVGCAVKLPSVRARWTRWVYREAVALARVKHRALPAVLEVGEVDDLPYLVMELVAGETLAERLRKGPLDESAAVALLDELLDVLGAVHDAGLVHRDIKPRNIILEAAGGALKLVDFGFATPVERAGRDDVAGTLAYAAPEQLVVPARVDARTDLYAVGRVLLECLTGRSCASREAPGPFGAEARAELVAAAVSVPLADIVAGLLQREPQGRYASARTAKADLDRMARGEPVLGPGKHARARRSMPVVARAAELGRVVDYLGGRAEGGRVAIVTGAAGAGKSRLLAAAAARLEERGVVIEARCRKDDPPLSTLRRLLEAFASTGEGEATGEDIFASLGNLGSIATLIAPRLSPARAGGMHPPPSGGADTLAEGAAEILLRLGAMRPLVVLVDDIQWMDPASADALLRVADRIGGARVGMLLGARNGPAATAVERFRAAQRDRTLVVELGPLTGAQAGELLASFLGERSVDEALVRRIHALSDGTALGVLEVLGAYLDEGAVRPHARGWRFDVDRAERVVLPSGTLALLGRRLGELPAATQRVLEAAAVIGTSFEDELLARVVELSVDDVGFALAGARRAGLLEPDAGASHRFVHDSLREMVLERIEAPAGRRLHQLVADALAARPGLDFERRCAIATHLVEGELAEDPARALEACRAAGQAALERFSNETALAFFAHARAAASLAGHDLEPADLRAVGEAQLRLGRLDESLASFEAALRSSSDPRDRARLLGRLAWVHQTRADPKRASELLDRAFLALGARMPSGSASSAARTAVSVAASAARRFVDRATRPERAEVELLSELHYQNARLGLEYGEPLRIVQSSAAALELSKHGASAIARARARAIHGFVLMNMRLRDAGARSFDEAEALAMEKQDPATTAFCLQLRSTAAISAGEMDLGTALARECTGTYGPWLEINEFCYDVANVELVEGLRGRSLEAWSWIELGLERLRRSRTRPAAVEYLLHRARATMGALGVDPSSDWLRQQLDAVPLTHGGQGFHRLVSWGPRARWYVERAELGEEFEALVRAFEAEHPDPKEAHLVLSEYYVAVMHARSFQALRAPAYDRDRPVAALRSAISDLRAVAKLPLLRAHLLLGEGSLAWLEGDEREALKSLAAAEQLAEEQCCPWVLYGVARTRAHKLRAEGRADAARDQARIAETLATQHGATHRARWVREELALPVAPSVVGSRSEGSSRSNRQLLALLNVVQAPRRDLKIEQQAVRVLQELIGTIPATAGALLFRPEANSTGTAVYSQRADDTSFSIGAESPHGALLHSVHQSGTSWPRVDGEATEPGGVGFDPARMIAVPLNLYEKPVGALCLERASTEPPFTADDRSLVELLSHQVPITLEIARLLFEREQLQNSLQQARKMEAIGQLAGGLAHDFNNMLSAMRIALSTARERAAGDPELTIELDIISDATTRAAQLTGQLLSFSRQQPLPVAVHDVNQLVVRLEQILRRVVGSNVKVKTDLAAGVDAVELDQGSFDQALVNLVINARDAMPEGGSVTLRTKNVVLGEAAAQRNGVPPGPYVEVEVADTGVGMSAETLTRIFEPFFTTKPSGSGSGLGLAMVYTFARNCGGAVEVSSELGQGTQFRLYLKARPNRSIAPGRGAGSVRPTVVHEVPDTILVVDDDDLVRRSIAKILEQHGYRVLAAGDHVEAIDVARNHEGRIALAILDVLMPGGTGVELGRRLNDLNLASKLLFVSGLPADRVSLDGEPLDAEMLLQKPFSQVTLLERVRELVHH